MPEVLKENALMLARDHKRTCQDPGCNISMALLAVLLQEAGIELTKTELSELT
jgi:hypothetical protein